MEDKRALNRAIHSVAADDLDFEWGKGSIEDFVCSHSSACVLTCLQLSLLVTIFVICRMIFSDR